MLWQFKWDILLQTLARFQSIKLLLQEATANSIAYFMMTTNSISAVQCGAIAICFCYTLLSLTSPIAQHIVNIFGAYTFLPLRLTKDLRLWCHQTKCGKQNELRRQNVCITKREETM